MNPPNDLSQESGDWKESPLSDHTRRSLSARLMLRMSLVISLVVVVGITSSYWLPAGQRLWQQIFPYKGSALMVNLANGALLGMNPATGTTIWQTPPGSRYRFSGVVDSHNAYAITSGTQLVALDKATGEIRWKYQSSSLTLPQIMGIRNNRLYVLEIPTDTSASTFMFDSFSLTDGKRLFQTLLTEPVGKVEPFFLFGAQRIYLGGAVSGPQGGTLPTTPMHLDALDALSGKVVWTFAPADAFRVNPLQEQNGLVVVTSVSTTQQQSVISILNAADGTPAWKISASFYQVVLDQENGYTINQAGAGTTTITAFQRGATTPRWQVSLPHNAALFSSLVLSYQQQQFFLVSWLEDTMTGTTAIDTQSGTILWEIHLNRSSEDLYAVDPVIGGDTLFFKASETLSAYQMTGKERWSMPLSDSRQFAIAGTDVLYLASPNNHLQAIDSVKGTKTWERILNGQIDVIAPA